MEGERRDTLRVLLILFVWLDVVTIMGLNGRIAQLRPPLPQIMIAVLTLLLALGVARVPPLRRFAFRVDPRVLVAFHLTRFVGASFLALHRQGRLPYGFAVPGGWGDIVVAGLALLLLISGPPDTRGRRRAYFLWNVLGLLDILFVVATAARLGLADPASMHALLEFPMSLIPTFLVPLILVTHGVLWIRLRRKDE